ncbi:hypothetical protein [Paenibacillus guangzhouensis]|uniref:hypothetical protein n=1 Tax=Paenibacillus guangzhouensis TaxID=1473112 RepID=UPI001266EEB2|nr:hypothetical protein [Paenibacillus guangzhouensis]
MYRIFRLPWLILVMVTLVLGSSTVHADEGKVNGRERDTNTFSQIAWAQRAKASHHTPIRPSSLATAAMMTDIFHKLDVQMPREFEGLFELGTPIARVATAWLPGDLMYYGDFDRNRRQQMWVGIVVDSNHIAYAGPE